MEQLNQAVETTTQSSSSSLPLILGVIMLIAGYFIPTIFAVLKKKPNLIAIGALNFFLGWTLIGWVVALVWALSNNTTQQNVIIQQQPFANTLSSDKFGELEKLRNLLDKNVISQEEFEIQKAKILNQ